MECGASKEVLAVKVSLDGYYYRRAESLLMFYLCLMCLILQVCVELIYANMMDEVMECIY